MTMKRAFFGVLVGASVFYGLAEAAPTTQKAATQVLFSGILTDDTPLNVSACSQIRVTASVVKDGRGAVSLWDESATDLLAAPLILQLEGGETYKSLLLETPGTVLTLSGFGYDGLGNRSPPSAAVYCR
jgi:hypothetical protein